MITTVENLTEDVEKWDTQTFIVGDMSILEKVWDSIDKLIPKHRTVTIVENGNLSDIVLLSGFIIRDLIFGLMIILPIYFHFWKKK